MIKRISLIIFSLLLILFATISAFATSYMDRPKVYDDDDLLTSGEQAALTQALEKMSEEYNCDVVVATVQTLGDMDSEEYSDYLYDLMDYGMLNDGKCIMLLVCLEYRDWALTPYGDASNIFTMDVQDEMIDEFLPYLSDEDFYSAFCSFAESCEYYLELSTSTTDEYPYSPDEDYFDNDFFDDDYFIDYPHIGSDSGNPAFNPLWIVIALVMGIVIAFIAVFIMKSQLKSVRFQPAANNYIRSGSMNVTLQRDIYLYSTVSRTPKPKNNSSSGGGIGGGIGGSISAGPRSSGKF